MDIGRLVNAADIAADVLRAQTERIVSLETDLLTKEDQIGGLTSELERAKREYAELNELVNHAISDLFTALNHRPMLVNKENPDALAYYVRLLGQQLAASQAELERARRQAEMNETHGRNLKHENGSLTKQLAASQAEAAALTQLVNGFTRREDALRATLTDDDILVYLADVELPRPAAEHIAEFSVMVFREGMARVALATPSTAAERVQVDVAVREALEFYANRNRYNLNWSLADVGDGRKYPQPSDINCDGGSRARTALAALDAATGKEASAVEEVKSAD